MRLFNAHYDDHGFQPIVVFDEDGRFVTALLRPAKRPKGVEIRAFLRRLVGAIRANWPNVQILVRADSHCACPEVPDWCEANGLDYVFGLAPTRTLRRHITGLEASTAARFEAAPTAGKVRRFKEFFDAAFAAAIGQHPAERDAVLVVERQHPVIQQIGADDRRLDVPWVAAPPRPEDRLRAELAEPETSEK